MKKLLLASILSAAPLLAAASDYAPQDFDFSALHGQASAAYGTVTHVREVPFEREPAGLAETEHAIRPDTADELVVLLDDARAITVVQDGPQRFVAGQRVRVTVKPSGAQVERSAKGL